MAEKMKPDKLMLDVRQADAAGLSYGRWRFEETERIRKEKEIIRAAYAYERTRTWGKPDLTAAGTDAAGRGKRI